MRGCGVAEGAAESYIEAIQMVLGGLGMDLAPRKCVWCNYPALHDGLGLQEKTEKQIEKAIREGDLEDWPDRQWFVGVPRFRVIVRGIPHLSVEIDLYLQASFRDKSCWMPLDRKADKFDFPLALLDSLPRALMKGELEVGGAQVAGREDGWTTYEVLGREWRVPDSFLGFLWALAEKKMGLEGLLDPTSLLVLEKAKALPQAAVLAIPASAQNSPGEGGDVQDVQTVVSALTNLAYPKKQAEQALAQARFPPGATVEDKIRITLQHLGKQ